MREKKGWSQEKLALTAELDRTYIPSIEKGDRNVSIIVLEKLAKALKVSIKESYLLKCSNNTINNNDNNNQNQILDNENNNMNVIINS